MTTDTVIEIQTQQHVVVEAEPTVVSVVDTQVLALGAALPAEIIEVGTQGPPGANGADGKDGVTAAFVFTQNTPASTWVVNHNFGRRALATVSTLGGAQVLAEVLHTSPNQLVVYFDAPTAGQVACVAMPPL